MSHIFKYKLVFVLIDLAPEYEQFLLPLLEFSRDSHDVFLFCFKSQILLEPWSLLNHVALWKDCL